MSERTSAEVEREVVAKRNAVEETLEALRAKMSSGQIVNSLTRSFTGAGGQGGELMSNLARQVRDNPLPVALTGIGLAWLLTGQARAARRADIAEEEAVADDLTVYDRAAYAADALAHGVEHAVRELIAGRYDVEADLIETGATFDEAEISADEAEHGAEYVVRQLKAGAYRLVVPETPGHTYDRSRLAADQQRFGADYVVRKHLGGVGPADTEAAGPPGEDEAVAPQTPDASETPAAGPARKRAVRARIRRLNGREVGDRVLDVAGGARDVGRQLQQDLEKRVSAEPLVAGIVGVAIGVVLGALLPFPQSDAGPPSNPSGKDDDAR